MIRRFACLTSCAVLLIGGAKFLRAYSLLDYYKLRNETVAGVKPGGGVVVKTREGQTYKGQFLEREGARVTIRDQEGHTRTFEWTELAWVRAQAKGMDDLAPIGFGGKDEIEPESNEPVDAR